MPAQPLVAGPPPPLLYPICQFSPADGAEKPNANNLSGHREAPRPTAQICPPKTIPIPNPCPTRASKNSKRHQHPVCRYSGPPAPTFPACRKRFPRRPMFLMKYPSQPGHAELPAPRFPPPFPEPGGRPPSGLLFLFPRAARYGYLACLGSFVPPPPSLKIPPYFSWPVLCPKSGPASLALGPSIFPLLTPLCPGQPLGSYGSQGPGIPATRALGGCWGLDWEIRIPHVPYISVGPGNKG